MEKGDDEGLCFNGLEVALGCTVGQFLFIPFFFIMQKTVGGTILSRIDTRLLLAIGGHWLWGQVEHSIDDLLGR